MSWPQWSTTTQPAVSAVPPVLNATTPVINSAPTVAPPGLQYTPEQWAQMQQQNWNQWAQWQQQYQQWHQQYGAEYQKSMNALAQAAQQQAQPPVASLPNLSVPPPLPVDTKPPLPVEEPPPVVSNSYTTAPPSITPFSTAPPPLHNQGYNTVAHPPYQNKTSSSSWHNQSQTYRLEASNQNKRPFEQQTNDFTGKRPHVAKSGWPSQVASTSKKDNTEELSDAEKKFDKQFAEWEAQFNKWKEQNAAHPDKEQYREYEKKWEAWRAQLLERREHMKKKRLGLVTDSTSKPKLGQSVNTIQPVVVSPLSNFTHPPPILQSSNPTDKIETGLFTKGTHLSGFPKSQPSLHEPSKNIPTNDINEFIKPDTSGGIPGLDLVKDEKCKDVLLNSEENNITKESDLIAISKGINSILGDHKLLNMLSLVSQNTNPRPDVLTSAISKIKEGDSNSQVTMAPEHTNQSIDEHSNQSGGFGQRELINNFDDQTRSSFTLNEFDNTTFNKYQFNKFGSHQDRIGDKNRSKFTEQMQGRGGEAPHQIGGSRPSKFGDEFGSVVQDRFQSPKQEGPPNRYTANENKFGCIKEYEQDFSRNSFSARDDSFTPLKDPVQTEQDEFGYLPNRVTNFEAHDRFTSNEENYEFNKYGLRQSRFVSESNQDRFGLHYDKFNSNDERFERNQNRLMQYNRPSFSQKLDKFPSNYEEFPVEQNFLENEGNCENQDYSEQDFYEYNDAYNENYEDYQEDLQYDENCDDYDYNTIAANFENDEPENRKDEYAWDQYKESYHESNGKAPLKKTTISPEAAEIFQAIHVVEYDHKSIKNSEPEILLEPIHMFDYRHKPLSRIPLPQRPKWLLDTVKNIREFDPPLIVRQYEPPNLRRFPPPDRRIERYPTSRRNYEERNFPRNFEDRRSYDRSNQSWENKPTYHEERKNLRQDMHIDLEEDKISDTEWPEDDDFEIVASSESRDIDNSSKNMTNFSNNVVLIEDLINPPGRFKRPPRIVIILRGPPGSGKTFLAKLIKDKEVENGGSAPRILSLDDYFMIEQEKEVFEDGKKVIVKDMIYEYEPDMEESYRTSLIKSFKKTITDGYFSFIIVDNINDKVKYFGEMWSFAKQNGFQVYICQLELDVQSCSKRNIHGRSEEDIRNCVASWERTPSHHPILDATSLLQAGCIPEVEMEEVNSPEESDQGNDKEDEDEVVRSKWDNFDCSVDNLAKLDGLRKSFRHRTMEEYLQLDTEWTPIKCIKPGQKRVRWADLEEQKEQEKMRAIGFVVGHTDWSRMMDPTGGSSALTQTKYIERTGRQKLDQK